MISALRSCFSFEKNLEALTKRDNSNIAVLDGLRVIATFYVILYHGFHLAQAFFTESEVGKFVEYLNTFPTWLNWVWYGDRGVDIFFVLSGFLIGGLLFNEHTKKAKINIPRFYWRRALRLMPLYLFLIIVFYKIGDGKGIDYIWANILYVNNYLQAENVFIAWSWSLAVEQQFYWVFPLLLTLVFFRTKHKLTVLISLFILSFIIRWLIILTDESLVTLPNAANMFHLLPESNTNLGEKLYTNLYSRYGALILGVIGAYLNHYHSTALAGFFQTKKSDLIAIISIVFMALWASLPVYKPLFEPSKQVLTAYFVFDRNIFSIAILYLMLALLYPTAFRTPLAKLLSLKIFHPLAQLSYSLYLFHPLFLLPVGIMVAGVMPASQLLYSGIFIIVILGTAFCALFCIFTYLFIERPFMNMRNLKRHCINTDLDSDQLQGAGS